MEKSMLYNLIETGLAHKWRDKIEQDDDCEFIKTEQEALQELTAELNGKAKELLTTYVIALENRINYLYYNINIKFLNFGIKAGMELQSSFAEYE